MPSSGFSSIGASTSLADGSPPAVGEIKRIELLGSSAELKWSRGQDGLRVELPVRKPCDHAFAPKIRF